MNRETHTARVIRAGCYNCDPTRCKWEGHNAQAVAARHYDATVHTTWVEIGLMVQYGSNYQEPAEKTP